MNISRRTALIIGATGTVIGRLPLVTKSPEYRLIVWKVGGIVYTLRCSSFEQAYDDFRNFPITLGTTKRIAMETRTGDDDWQPVMAMSNSHAGLKAQA